MGRNELELWGKFLLAVESVGKVYSSNAAVGVDRHPQSLDVIAAVCSSGEVRQVELNLVPALVQPHWHCADEGLDPGRRLVVRRPESPSHVLIVEDLHFEGEIFFELND